MIAFDVKDMTCGHCASTITTALKGVDKDAQVSIDLARQRVTVLRAASDTQELQAAIAEAGYTPTLAQDTVAAAPARGGACCGSCR